MLGKPRILSLFFPTRLINSIKHEHSCKILYVNAGKGKGNDNGDFVDTLCLRLSTIEQLRYVYVRSLL